MLKQDYTGAGDHFLLQGIFLTQGSHQSLLHFWRWKADSLPLCPLGSPKDEEVILNREKYAWDIVDWLTQTPSLHPSRGD